MTGISRRSALALAGAVSLGAVLAGCTPVSTRPGSTPATSTPPTPAGPPDWAALAAGITGTLARQGDATYDSARLTENPRFDNARPLAVLSAKSAADVSAAVTFASRYAVPLSLRSGGHSYSGYSAGGASGTGVSPSLVIDTRPMNSVTLAADNSVRIGAGATLAQVYDTVGSRGRAIAGGSCATVGITGLTLGGGVGVLVREFGLTCDSMTEVELVTADGVIRTVNASTEPDLFWACRGGGGGHLGVVTAITLTTRQAPDLSMFSLAWPFSMAAFVIAAWQHWAPNADSRLWSTLKLLNGVHHSEPGLTVSGTWLGDAADLPAQLAPFLNAVGKPTRDSSVRHSYRDAMMAFAGCSGIAISRCTTAAGGALKRETFTGTSHVAYVVASDSGVKAILDAVARAKEVPALIEGGISLDALGGSVRDISVADTAFAHRAALMTVQYTATCADGAAIDPLQGWVRGFRAALEPTWANGAYVNYPDAAIHDSSTAYFAGNAPRLEKIARAFDPRGIFCQPQPW